MSAGSFLPDTRSRAYAIASRAGCDHRTVLGWMRGGDLPACATSERIKAIAAELGIVPEPAPAALATTSTDRS